MEGFIPEKPPYWPEDWPWHPEEENDEDRFYNLEFFPEEIEAGALPGLWNNLPPADFNDVSNQFIRFLGQVVPAEFHDPVTGELVRVTRLEDLPSAEWQKWISFGDKLASLYRRELALVEWGPGDFRLVLGGVTMVATGKPVLIHWHPIGAEAADQTSMGDQRNVWNGTRVFAYLRHHSDVPGEPWSTKRYDGTGMDVELGTNVADLVIPPARPDNTAFAARQLDYLFDAGLQAESAMDWAVKVSNGRWPAGFGALQATQQELMFIVDGWPDTPEVAYPGSREVVRVALAQLGQLEELGRRGRAADPAQVLTPEAIAEMRHVATYLKAKVEALSGQHDLLQQAVALPEETPDAPPSARPDGEPPGVRMPRPRPANHPGGEEEGSRPLRQQHAALPPNQLRVNTTPSPEPGPLDLESLTRPLGEIFADLSDHEVTSANSEGQISKINKHAGEEMARISEQAEEEIARISEQADAAIAESRNITAVLESKPAEFAAASEIIGSLYSPESAGAVSGREASVGVIRESAVPLTEVLRRLRISPDVSLAGRTPRELAGLVDQVREVPRDLRLLRSYIREVAEELALTEQAVFPGADALAAEHRRTLSDLLLAERDATVALTRLVDALEGSRRFRPGFVREIARGAAGPAAVLADEPAPTTPAVDPVLGPLRFLDEVGQADLSPGDLPALESQLLHVPAHLENLHASARAVSDELDRARENQAGNVGGAQDRVTRLEQRLRDLRQAERDIPAKLADIISKVKLARRKAGITGGGFLDDLTLKATEPSRALRGGVDGRGLAGPRQMADLVAAVRDAKLAVELTKHGLRLVTGELGHQVDPLLGVGGAPSEMAELWQRQADLWKLLGEQSAALAGHEANLAAARQRMRLAASEDQLWTLGRKMTQLPETPRDLVPLRDNAKRIAAKRNGGHGWPGVNIHPQAENHFLDNAETIAPFGGRVGRWFARNVGQWLTGSLRLPVFGRRILDLSAVELLLPPEAARLIAGYREAALSGDQALLKEREAAVTRALSALPDFRDPGMRAVVQQRLEAIREAALLPSDQGPEDIFLSGGSLFPVSTVSLYKARTFGVHLAKVVDGNGRTSVYVVFGKTTDKIIVQETPVGLLRGNIPAGSPGAPPGLYLPSLPSFPIGHGPFSIVNADASDLRIGMQTTVSQDVDQRESIAFKIFGPGPGYVTSRSRKILVDAQGNPIIATPVQEFAANFFAAIQVIPTFKGMGLPGIYPGAVADFTLTRNEAGWQFAAEFWVLLAGTNVPTGVDPRDFLLNLLSSWGKYLDSSSFPWFLRVGKPISFSWGGKKPAAAAAPATPLPEPTAGGTASQIVSKASPGQEDKPGGSAGHEGSPAVLPADMSQEEHGPAQVTPPTAALVTADMAGARTSAAIVREYLEWLRTPPGERDREISEDRLGDLAEAIYDAISDGVPGLRRLDPAVKPLMDRVTDQLVYREEFLRLLATLRDQGPGGLTAEQLRLVDDTLALVARLTQTTPGPANGPVAGSGQGSVAQPKAVNLGAQPWEGTWGGADETDIPVSPLQDPHYLKIVAGIRNGIESGFSGGRPGDPHQTRLLEGHSAYRQFFNDGSRAVRKVLSADEADAEMLAGYVGRVFLGTAMPVTYQAGKTTVYVQYVDGPMSSELDPAALEQLLTGPAGKLAALFHAVTFNNDNHKLNILRWPDGQPAPIDNARAFSYAGNWRYSAFIDANGGVPAFPAWQYARWRSQLLQLEPEFAARGKADWFTRMMQEFDRHAAVAASPEGAARAYLEHVWGDIPRQLAAAGDQGMLQALRAYASVDFSVNHPPGRLVQAYLDGRLEDQLRDEGRVLESGDLSRLTENIRRDIRLIDAAVALRPVPDHLDVHRAAFLNEFPGVNHLEQLPGLAGTQWRSPGYQVMEAEPFQDGAAQVILH
ncbi:MAG: hypothetical protein ACRDNZ_12360, partial [Streptosporangiaceae bacterium]